jgi:hypothetical protein
MTDICLKLFEKNAAPYSSWIGGAVINEAVK